jgi:hypothetical protein
MDGRHAHVDRATYRRRRIAAAAGAAALAVLVVVLLAYVWPGFAESSDASPAPVHVTATVAAPSATSSPSALPSGATPFLRALPGTVGPWVRTSAKAAPAGGVAQPTEAWTVDYRGQGDRITVTASQYTTAAAATAAFTKATASARSSSRGDVLVGGAKAGTYAVVPGSGGRTTVIWRNGTALLSATGPDAVVRQFYAAYSM